MEGIRHPTPCHAPECLVSEIYPELLPVPDIRPKRGHVYRLEEDPDFGRMHCLAVAAQDIPGMEGTFLAVRVTVTSQRHDFPMWVRLTSGDPCAGYVVTHDIDRRDNDEIVEDLGHLAMTTLLDVERELKRYLGL